MYIMKLLKIKNVANKVDLSVSQIHAMRARGTFPKGFRLADSRSTRWLEKDIDDWIEKQLNTNKVAPRIRIKQ